MNYAAAFLLLSSLAQAQPSLDQEAAALDLADLDGPTAAARRDWKLFAETGLGWQAGAAGLPARDQLRLSLDMQLDRPLGDKGRFMLASRLDASQYAGGEGDAVNTLRELWLGFRPQPQLLLEAGRINIRQGQALAWNPTDFLRARRVRSRISVDPQVVRHNRLGTVMLRAQHFSAHGSRCVMFAPRLSSQLSDDPLSPDWARSNDGASWQLTASERLRAEFSGDVLLYQREGEPVQTGASASLLWGQASTLYAEWTGGRRRPLSAAWLPEPEHWHTRLALGLSYTTAARGTLTLEYYRDSAAADPSQWEALQRAYPQLAQAVRLQALEQQELPTRHAAFAHWRWPDAGLPGLQLVLMARHDLVDRSQLFWGELSYVRENWQFALQWQERPPGRWQADTLPLAPRAHEISIRYFF